MVLFILLRATAHAAEPTPIEEATGKFYSVANETAAPAKSYAAPAAGETSRANAPSDVAPPVEIPIPLQGTSAAIGGSPSPAVSGLPIVAVLDFETGSLDRRDLNALSESLWGQLDLSEAVRMLPRDDTRRWLIANDLHPFMPYGPRLAMPLVIERLKAHYLVAGSINQVEGAYAVELSLYKVNTPVPIFKDAGARVATLQEMMLTMRRLAGEVLDAIELDLGRPLSRTHRPGEWAQTAANGGGAEKPVRNYYDEIGSEAPPIKAAKTIKTRVKKTDGLRSGFRKTGAHRAATAETFPAAENGTAVPGEEPAATVHNVRGAESAAMKPIKRQVETPIPSETEKTAEPAPEAKKVKPQEMERPAGTVPVHETSKAGQPPAHAEGEKEAKDPANPDQLYREAMAMPVKDETRLTRLERATKLAPNNATYSQQLAFDYYQRGRYADCVTLCDKALAQTPRDSRLLMIKGSAQISLCQWPAAVESCRMSVEADGSNNWARYNLALALEMMGSPKAADAWRDYLSRAASDPQHQSLLPEARQRLENLEKKHP